MASYLSPSQSQNAALRATSDRVEAARRWLAEESHASTSKVRDRFMLSSALANLIIITSCSKSPSIPYNEDTLKITDDGAVLWTVAGLQTIPIVLVGDLDSGNIELQEDGRWALKRVAPKRPRKTDPTTHADREYSQDELEFIKAVDEYKRNNLRPFPTCTELLAVARSLGYQKST